MIEGMRPMRTVTRLAGIAALALLVGACSSGAMFGGSDDASFANVNASQAQIDQAASAAIPAIASECPPIRIRPGTEFYRDYAGNRRSDPNALRYQGVLDRATRNCIVSNGLITVNMGAAGRVILGPSGSEANINVPLRFAVERDGMVVFSERFAIPVAATRTDVNEFAHTVEGVAIPYVGGEPITIWVGFDT